MERLGWQLQGTLHLYPTFWLDLIVRLRRIRMFGTDAAADDPIQIEVRLGILSLLALSFPLTR